MDSSSCFCRVRDNGLESSKQGHTFHKTLLKLLNTESTNYQRALRWHQIDLLPTSFNTFLRFFSFLNVLDFSGKLDKEAEQQQLHSNERVHMPFFACTRMPFPCVSACLEVCVRVGVNVCDCVCEGV